MSIYKYIEVDSLYRNRSEWPNPAQFQVDFRHAGVQSAATAKDPVSDQSPIYTWNSSFRQDVASLTVPISGIDTTASVSGSNILIIEAPLNTLRRDRNYYNNAIIELTDGATVVRLRIADYQFIEQLGGVDKAQINVSPGFPSSFGAVTGTEIENPTNATNTAVVPQIFIPAALDAFNAFVGMEIENITTKESRTIIEFNAITGMATLDSTTSTTWDVANNNFVIRESAHCNGGFLTGVSSTGRAIQLSSAVFGDQTGNFIRMTEPVPVIPVLSTNPPPYTEERRILRYVMLDGTFIIHGGVGTNTFTLSVSDATTNYIGTFLTDVTTGETREIATYDNTTLVGTVTVNWGITGVATDVFTIRTAYVTPFSSNPSLVGIGGAFVAHGGGGTNTFQLAATASTTNGYYIDATITDTTTGEVRTIVTYDGVTQTGTVTSNWTAGAAGDLYTIGTTKFEIECFTRDNAYPMSYGGSTVSSQGQCCYEVSLMNLILPNGTLDTGTGGRIAFFPFVYVEFQNVTATGAGLSNVIYSNNPHARKMLFRSIVSDTQNPLLVPFAKFGGSGMSQTIKFKPNDVLKFGVYLPNGESFKLFESDTTSPTPPNPLVQITAVFSIKKMS